MSTAGAIDRLGRAQSAAQRGFARTHTAALFTGLALFVAALIYRPLVPALEVLVVLWLLVGLAQAAFVALAWSVRRGLERSARPAQLGFGTRRGVTVVSKSGSIYLARVAPDGVRRSIRLAIEGDTTYRADIDAVLVDVIAGRTPDLPAGVHLTEMDGAAVEPDAA